MKYIEEFVILGQQLPEFLEKNDPVLTSVINKAIGDNPWFAKESIRESIQNICKKMLSREKLYEWAKMYDYPELSQKNVLVIMAGNIPMVGFFDMLCVLASGHNCIVKLSSKDYRLMDFTIDQLQKINPAIPISSFSNNLHIDSVIATGSSNTNRYFKYMYGNIKHIFRKSRYSIAVITGKETPEQIGMLQKDILSYYGMGCRNVCCILIPEDYDINKLNHATAIPEHHKYRSRLKLHKSILKMNKTDFYDFGSYTLTPYSDGEPGNLPDIKYMRYNHMDEVNKFIDKNRENIQCIVSDIKLTRDTVNYGTAQEPELLDYPDGIDLIDFLSKL